MKCFVTGAAGFVGSNLLDRLLASGHEVTGFDNLSTGFEAFLANAFASASFHLVRGDLLADGPLLNSAMAGCDIVFHLAANADVRFGADHPRRDLEQNCIATHNVLEAMRQNNIKRIAFASTGSVYGESAVVPTPEDAPFPVQTSLYAASKLASEAMITAYCETFGFQCWIFRFVSILGERYSHGHVIDFYRQLIENPGRLRVLGNGKQRKSYLYVQDCISAIEVAIEKAFGRVNIFNLGVSGCCELDDSIAWICEELAVKPEIEYTGGDRGWPGDNPLIHLDTAKIELLGWQPQLTIRDSVVRTLRFLKDNPWLPDVADRDRRRKSG